VVIAERIRERVKALVFDGGKGPLRVTLSLGIAAVPDDAAGKGDLVARADACLYHAKRSGRDRSVPASSLHAPAPGRLGRAAAAVTSPEPAGP
jgi:diguanylate cyclase (GGDEF)-like protein